MLWWAALLACSRPSPTTPIVPSTGDTGLVATSCPDPTGPDVVDVVDVVVGQPWHANEASIVVTLSGEATVAVACVLASDPREVHLVEGTAPAAVHALRLAGLLADATYDCTAAPVCPVSAAGPHTFTLTTRSLDDAGLPDAAATVFAPADGPAPASGLEYVLLNHSGDCFSDGERLVVFDREARIRWHGQAHPNAGPSLEFAFHGGDWFTWGGGWGPNAQGRPRRVALYGADEIYDAGSAIPDVSGSRFHHDGKELADGRFLTLEEPFVTDGGGGFRGFGVRRIDPDAGAVDFEYHSQRGFDEGHLPGGSGDAWHANWVDIVDVGGEEVLHVSLCNLGWTVAIDVPTGDWRWTFGSGGDFALVDVHGDPLPASEFPQCEHGLQKRGDRLLVYDNGWGRDHSRATEYRLDEGSMTATLLWTWTEPDWHETTLGSVDWLPSDHVLIGMGHAECFSSNRGDRSTVVEIDPDSGTKLWELELAALTDMMYRADWADPCALFANARYCPRIADRLVTLAPILSPKER